MNKQIEKFLNLADHLTKFNNQLQLCKDKCIDSNILFEQGHQFSVNSTLLTLCHSMLQRQRVTDVILLDDFQNPVLISDLNKFVDDAWHLYQTNLNRYYLEYQELIKNRGKFNE